MPKRSTSPAQGKKTVSRKPKAPDAIDLLKRDHEQVRALFQQFSASGTMEKETIADRIFKELEIHATLEEELFYPALKNHGDPDELASLQEEGGNLNGANVLDATDEDDEDEDNEDPFVEDADYEDDDDSASEDDIITAAFEDHQHVKELIHRLKGLDPQASDFHQGMMELEAIVSDHVAQEEEILFVEAKIRLDIKTLGEQMLQRKHDLLSMAA